MAFQLRYTGPSKLSKLIELLHKEQPRGRYPTPSKFITEMLWTVMIYNILVPRLRTDASLLLNRLVGENVVQKLTGRTNGYPIYQFPNGTMFTEYGEMLNSDDEVFAYENDMPKPKLGTMFRTPGNPKGELQKGTAAANIAAMNLPLNAK